jgi:hypothetical protein
MADPVKISDLPALSSVQPNDILPVVDSALTQTSKCTASQIAAIGGGPPGDNTVTTAKIVSAAVTAAKHGFTAPDKLVSRILAGAGEGVEIPCTSYARGLLSTADSAGALSYLGGLQSANNPTFTGTVTVNGTVTASGDVTTATKFISSYGTASAPAFTFTGDTNCGIAQLGGADTISFVANGVEQLRISVNGARQSIIGSSTTLYSEFRCRAWGKYRSGAVYGGNVTSFYRNSVGVYTVNLTQALPTASGVGDYSVVATCDNSGENFCRLANMGTAQFQIAVSDCSTGGYRDATNICFALFQ